MHSLFRISLSASLLIGALVATSFATTGGDAKQGTRNYDDYESPKVCLQCHDLIYGQWDQAMMSKSFTHKWDEVEYFDLAVEHGKAVPKFSPVADGCNGCHAPLAWMAGDIPTKRPGLSRADESVSCDICHTITGFEGEIPVNFNWVSDPGKLKRGPRQPGDAVPSPHHEMTYSEFIHQPEFCGTCHNEQDPWGVFVKSTYSEWKAGPYSEEGVRCHDCHMTYAPAKSAKMGNAHNDMRLHLFHGAHDPGKVNGVVELRIQPDIRDAEPGDPVKFTLALFNQKTGHKFPTGSVEDRIVWVDVVAKDAQGNEYHLAVDPKGFDGEEWTIGSDDLAYQDMAVPLNKPDFKGVRRDGIVPVGDRIFRMPYLDEQGRMTIMQWNTAKLGPDYRLGPRETKLETYTFEIPNNAAPGPMTVTATMYYSKLVSTVADLLGVPEEAEPYTVNSHSTSINVLD